MRTIIHAKSEDALRNGSFVRQNLGKHNSTFSQYMNGDFIGWFQTVPSGLKMWTLKDAKKFLPKGI